MDERRRRDVYSQVKRASGAFGALRRRAEAQIETGEKEQVEDAGAILEMMLVREFDDWYTRDTLPNVIAAMRNFCDAITTGKELHPEIERAGGLLAELYARLNYDRSYSHELCKTLVEKRPGLLREGEPRILVTKIVSGWDEFRTTEPVADVLAAASEPELYDLGDVLRLERKELPTDLDAVREKLESELMYAGADSIVSVVRGRGVPYEEIARDVASRRDIAWNRYERSSPPVLERRLLLSMIEASWDAMEPSMRRRFIDAATEEGIKGIDTNHSGKALMFTLLTAGRLSGFVAYELAAVVANAVARQILGRGLSLAANAALMRGLSVALGPIGIGTNLLTLVPAVSGPAYRKTVPAVLVVGAMRARQRAGVAAVEATH